MHPKHWSLYLQTCPRYANCSVTFFKTPDNKVQTSGEKLSLEIIRILVLATTGGLHCWNSIDFYFFWSDRTTLLLFGVFDHGAAAAANGEPSTPTCYSSKLSVNQHFVSVLVHVAVPQQRAGTRAPSCTEHKDNFRSLRLQAFETTVSPAFFLQSTECSPTVKTP